MSSNTRETPANPGMLTSLYHFFNSIRLTVFLFITLGLVSIAGTIIEQGADPSKYAQIYSENTIRIFHMLGLFDMYHTLWFFTLLLLLLVNLIVCTIERLPRVFRFARNIKPVLKEGDEKKYPFAASIRMSGNSPEDVEALLRRYVRLPVWILLLDAAAVAFAVFLVFQYSLNVLEFAAFIVVPMAYIVLLNFRGRVVRTEEEGTVYLFVNQWLLSRFGVYITHVSILIIFLGAIIGSLFGFKGFMAINEGETKNRMFLRQDKLVDSVSASVSALFSRDSGADPSQNPEGGAQFKVLPFAIRCDDFSISYYPNTGRPKDYTSDLTVVRDGKDTEEKTIEVNDPLVVDKIYFYQSSYGQSGRPGLVVLSVTPPDGEARDYRTPVNGSFHIQGTDVDVQVQSFLPDFTIENGHVRQRSAEMINPAVYLSAARGEKPLFSGWLFPNYPDYSLKTGKYVVRFKDYWGSQYTGLQVAYDPGVEIVWIGCSLLVVGLMISFFNSHQRIWARVRGNEVVLAGSAHKNRMAFEKKFNDLKHLLKE